MFHLLIVHRGCEKYQKVPNRQESCTCNFEGFCPTYQYSNLTTPLTVLFARDRYKKKFERLGCKREHLNVKYDTQQTPNGRSHAMTRVIIKICIKEFSIEVRAGTDFETPGSRPRLVTFVMAKCLLGPTGLWCFISASGFRAE